MEVIYKAFITAAADQMAIWCLKTARFMRLRRTGCAFQRCNNIKELYMEQAKEKRFKTSVGRWLTLMGNIHTYYRCFEYCDESKI